MSSLLNRLAFTLKMFVQADASGVFNFMDLKEAFKISEQVILELLEPETIKLATGEKVFVDVDVKYDGGKYPHFWRDIQLTIDLAIAYHHSRHADILIEKIIPPYPLAVTRFNKLLIEPIINHFNTFPNPHDVYFILSEDNNIFNQIDKYLNDIEVKTHRDDVLVAQHVLNKQIKAVTPPQKAKQQKQRQETKRRRMLVKRYEIIKQVAETINLNNEEPPLISGDEDNES